MKDKISEEMAHYLCSDDEYLGDVQGETYGEPVYIRNGRQKDKMAHITADEPFMAQLKPVNHRVH